MSSSKRNWPFWTLRQVFIRVYRLEIPSVMLVFRPRFVNYCPSNLPSSPFLVSMYSTNRQCVAGRVWGVLSPVGDHILQEFYSVPDPIQSYKIARPNQRGGGLRQISTCRKVFRHRSYFTYIAHPVVVSHAWMAATFCLSSDSVVLELTIIDSFNSHDMMLQGHAWALCSNLTCPGTSVQGCRVSVLTNGRRPRKITMVTWDSLSFHRGGQANSSANRKSANSWAHFAIENSQIS